MRNRNFLTSTLHQGIWENIKFNTMFFRSDSPSLLVEGVVLHASRPGTLLVMRTNALNPRHMVIVMILYL
jgi:hypothetical protein